MKEIMRSQILRKNGISVINDCYNANPASVRAALDLLRDMRVDGERVAVLGDMLELGAESAELHAEVGDYAASRVQRLLALGTHSEHTANAAEVAGLPAQHYRDFDSLIRDLRAHVQVGDAVLVKASRSVAFEGVVEALTDDEA